MNTDTALRLVRTSAPALLLGVALTGCVVAPTYVETVRTIPVPSTEVYAYPAKGQSTEQQAQDRYTCYQWASEKTGVEPSTLPRQYQVRTVMAQPAPNGAEIVASTITGALIGAAVSNPRNAGTGAAVGAAIGAVVGAASESANAANARRVEQLQAQQIDAQSSGLAQRVSDYRRAMTSCLEGRGYRVQ